MRYAIYLFCLCLFAGCSAQKQYQRELNKTKLFLSNHPDVEAGLCAKDFPIKTDSVKQGNVITKTDTLTTVSYITKKDTVVKTVTRNVIQLKIRVDTFYREDMAKYSTMADSAQRLSTLYIQAKQQLADKDVQLKAKTAQSLHRLFWIIGLIALIVIYFGLKIYFTFFGGGYLSSFASMFKK